jgi:serine O-acetyltransferase
MIFSLEITGLSRIHSALGHSAAGRPGRRGKCSTAKAPFFKHLKEDIDNIVAKDPAARGPWEVLFCYPGLHAVMVHGLTHWLWTHRMRFAARFLSNLGKMLTGVEIHPARDRAAFFHRSRHGVVIANRESRRRDLVPRRDFGGTSLEVGKTNSQLWSMG